MSARSRLRTVWQVLKTAVSEFVQDDAMTLAAGVAFYTALSFAPMLVILVNLAGFAGEDTQQRVVHEFTALLGEQAGEAVRLVMSNARDERFDVGSLPGILGALTLAFSATGVFAQLQYAMNKIWNVEARPGRGVWSWVRRRLLSLGMIFALLFLLMASLTVSAVIAAVFARGGTLWNLVNLGSSLVVFAAIWTAIFKYLPDVNLAWRDAALGGLVTATLFIGGKYLIGLYLGQASVGSPYGAAGSLVVLLVWVYYSALIVFFGAELTQVYARRWGKVSLRPHAVWIDRRGAAKSDEGEEEEVRAEEASHPPRPGAEPHFGPA